MLNKLLIMNNSWKTDLCRQMEGSGVEKATERGDAPVPLSMWDAISYFLIIRDCHLDSVGGGAEWRGKGD